MTKNINMSDMLHTLFYKQLQVTNNCHVNAKKIIKSSQRPKPPPGTWNVAARNGSRDIIDHMTIQFANTIGGPLEPSPYLQAFSRYSAPTHVNDESQYLLAEVIKN